ncbi:cytochrome P450 [Roridomyces roridus]|uniref:Cytochrome P450 n=1 Tax=Roridomyces roridus TaxID=1738132 RepID=A0AAD7FR28_9AGAR|nr:cytochrome P450 [Roridomyces roridus]
MEFLTASSPEGDFGNQLKSLRVLLWSICPIPVPSESKARATSPFCSLILRVERIYLLHRTMNHSALGLLAVFALIARAAFSKFRVRDDVPRLPGPSSTIASWIWGHELLVFQHAATQMYSIWARSFGGLFRIKAALFHPDIIVATDHAAVQHIFAKSDVYVKSPAFRPPIKNLLGEGLVWAEGQDWYHQRKMLSPAFSADSIKEMTPAIHECAERLETRLTNLLLLDISRSKNGTNLNIVQYISACTLDIIGIVGLSHSFAAQSARPGDMHSDAAQICASWDSHVNTGLKPLAFLAPLVVRAIPAVARVPLPLMQSQGVVKTIVRRIGRKILEREAQKEDSDHAPAKDILSILLRARRAGKDESLLSDEQILNNISTFTMVGHETTAGSLAFTLWELARNPAIQDRLREEILSCGRDLSHDDIQKLEFLDAIVKEGLRLHPASPQTERIALQDDIVPLSSSIAGIGDTFRLRKGQVIHIPFRTMNTNAEVWGPSADVFDPTRWLQARRDPASLPHGWSGILTFCDGPRNCLGWRLAVLEFKIILATLVRSIVFSETGVRVEAKISPTLQAVVHGKAGVLPLYLRLV